MRQFTLTQAYNGFHANTVFHGPFPTRGQSNMSYVPSDITPGPEGAEMCLFASFVENSSLFKFSTDEK